MTIRKGYSDGPEGQIHWRMATPSGDAQQADLYCFSPAPFGSIAYATLLPHLARDRRVIAPDYPGQAGSDGGSPHTSIEAYAASMLAVIADLSGEGPVDVLGFHSGCLVAAEVKRQAPEAINHVIMVDAPAFDPETRAKYLPMVGKPFELSPDLESLAKAWDMAVTKRLETQPLAHSLAMFADTVGNGPRMNATFHAAFTYDVETSLSSLNANATIIATQSSLLDPSRRAADMIPDCKLVELLEISRSVLDENAETTAAAILSSLA
ncbi:MAG: alpha/beta fold hydrolase [Pseudomonadota bacterium]